MQFVSQTHFSTLATNKFFQGLEFLFVTRLYSLGIVKNITRVIGKHNLVVDTVLPSLATCLEQSTRSAAVTNIHCRLKCNLSAVRPDSKTKVWTTYLLACPVNSGALRCFTDPL